MLKSCANDPKVRKKKTTTQVSEVSTQPIVHIQREKGPNRDKVVSRKRKHRSDSASTDSNANDSPQPNRR